jgi:hypothetical protein
MTEGPEPAVDSPRQLLSAAHELIWHVRRAQRGAWFPLVLLGLVVLAATPVYRFGSHGHVSCGPVTVTHGPGVLGGVSRTCFIAYGWPAFVYWLVALVLAYVVIAGFYVRQARRRGVGTRIRPYVIAGVAALVVVAAFWPVQQHLGHVQSGYPFDLAVHGLNPLLAIGVALFVLAWAERNWALLVFAAGYLAVTLLASFSDFPRKLLEEHGWVVTTRTIFLPGLWLAGAALLLGGAGFAIAERLRK